MSSSPPSEMPPLPDRHDADATWSYVENTVNDIYTQPASIDTKTHMDSYTAVHDYCTAMKHGASLSGQEIYKRLTENAVNHIRTVKQRINSCSDEALVQSYLEEWNRYANAAQIIGHLFDYLDRHWVKRVVDEGEKGIYDVYTLHLLQWYDELLSDVAETLAVAVAKLIEERRSGKAIEHDPTKAVVDLFISSGLADTDEVAPTDAYRYLFEQPIIEAAAGYDRPNLRIKRDHSVAEHTEKTISGWSDEEKLALRYLNPGAQRQEDTTDAPGATVKLASSDNVVVEVERQVATRSVVIQHVLQDVSGAACNVIPLPRIEEKILRRVLAWCEHHKSDPVASQSRENRRMDEIGEWDQEFVSSDTDGTFDLILAANYLNIKPLLALGTMAVANMIKGKSPEEIRGTFRIGSSAAETEGQ